jgi:two-component system, LytTR family, response regulator
MKAIIIDDEQKGRNLLNEVVKRYCPDLEIGGLAQNAAEGIALIRSYQPDFVFLDIQMPEVNGFQMLELLNEISFDIVFVTAYNDYAVKAYKYAAFDYLLKPVDPEELQDTVRRLREKQKNLNLQGRLDLLMKTLEKPHQLPSKITIHSTDGITILNISEIVYLEADGPYSIFYLEKGHKIVSSHNLKEYEEILEPHRFFRTHHSYLVNLNHIRKYVRSDAYVLLSNGQHVDVSKRRKDEFLQVLGQL